MRVICMASGVEGLKLYRQERPNMVLCDIFIPDKDGLETIKKLYCPKDGEVELDRQSGPAL